MEHLATMTAHTDLAWFTDGIIVLANFKGEKKMSFIILDTVTNSENVYIGEMGENTCFSEQAETFETRKDAEEFAAKLTPKTDWRRMGFYC